MTLPHQLQPYDAEHVPTSAELLALLLAEIDEQHWSGKRDAQYYFILKTMTQLAYNLAETDRRLAALTDKETAP